MPLEEALDKVKKRVEEVSSDIEKMRDTTRSLVKTSRPKPLKRIVGKRVESFRPLKLLEKRRLGEEESASAPE